MPFACTCAYFGGVLRPKMPCGRLRGAKDGLNPVQLFEDLETAEMEPHPRGLRSCEENLAIQETPVYLYAPPNCRDGLLKRVQCGEDSRGFGRLMCGSGSISIAYQSSGAKSGRQNRRRMMWTMLFVMAVEATVQSPWLKSCCLRRKKACRRWGNSAFPAAPFVHQPPSSRNAAFVPGPTRNWATYGMETREMSKSDNYVARIARCLCSATSANLQPLGLVDYLFVFFWLQLELIIVVDAIAVAFLLITETDSSPDSNSREALKLGPEHPWLQSPFE